MNETLATEMMKELKASNRRWFIAFLVTLIASIITIIGTHAGYLWYMNTPDTSTMVQVDGEGGNANYVGNDMNGVINNGKSDSNNN